MSELTGHVSQVIGPVVDVHFEISEGQEVQLPAIHEALTIRRNDGRQLVVEVQQHIGEDYSCLASLRLQQKPSTR